MMKICVGLTRSNDPLLVWTDGTGVAACGRTDLHGAHTVPDTVEEERVPTCPKCKSADLLAAPFNVPESKRSEYAECAECGFIFALEDGR